MKWIQFLLIANLGLSAAVLFRTESMQTSLKVTSQNESAGKILKDPMFYLTHKSELDLREEQIEEIRRAEKIYRQRMEQQKSQFMKLAVEGRSRFLAMHPIDIKAARLTIERVLEEVKKFKMIQLEGKIEARNVLDKTQFERLQSLIQ
mgnify:CR=1 FL=1